MAKDPICGMFVDEGERALKAESKGRVYYFCSEGCRVTFIAPAKELRRIRNMTVLSFILGIPILILSMFVQLPVQFNQGWVELVLASPVQFIAGLPFYRGAWHAVRARVANMDTLIVLGTTAAFGYSTGAVLFPGDFQSGTFFDASALIIGFILLGKLLEYRVRGRASEAVRRLLDMKPVTARVMRDGAELEVHVEEVGVGDLMVVRPGEKIPTDGVVVQGKAAIDERMITGESVPVDKGEGDEVIGSTVDTNGLVTVRATRVGSDTALAQIVRLVEDAQASQAPIQKLADRVSSYFVPAVVGIALASLVTWYLLGFGVQRGFSSFIAVLIVACPCALGLATPAAMVVAAGRGASHGILIKGGDAVERGSKVTAVVLDKTGTITAGEPSVTEVATTGGIEEVEVLGLAASAEMGSGHPAAKALVLKAKESGIRVERPGEFKEVPGRGVSATVGKNRVAVGNGKMMSDLRAEMGTSEGLAADLEEEARTVLFVAVDGVVQGVIGLSDTIKPGSKDAVGALKGMGLKVIMLTGDNEKTAKAVAREVGIDEVHAGATPAGKAEAVEDLKARGETVALVGDGVNDAPAMAGADFGVAIGSGADVAVEAAGVVLVRSDLRDVVGALRLSRATLSKIRQNLFWAFAYNSILIPVAAVGLLNPILAGAAMALSSVSVVTNSLTLNRVELGNR